MSLQVRQGIQRVCHRWNTRGLRQLSRSVSTLNPSAAAASTTPAAMHYSISSPRRVLPTRSAMTPRFQNSKLSTVAEYPKATDEKEALLEIQQLTSSNIQEHLSSNPRIEHKYEKTRIRMERNGRIPKKRPSKLKGGQKKNDMTPILSAGAPSSLMDLLSDENNPSSSSQTSLMDLLDEPLEDSKFDGTKSLDTASLMDLLNEPMDDDTSAASATMPASTGSMLDLLDEPPPTNHQSSLSTNSYDEIAFELSYLSQSTSLMDLLSAQEQQQQQIPSLDATSALASDQQEEPMQQMQKVSTSSSSLLDLLNEPNEMEESIGSQDFFMTTGTFNVDHNPDNATTGSPTIVHAPLHQEAKLFGASEGSAKNPSLQDLLAQGVALLASMTEREWRQLDDNDSEEDDEDTDDDEIQEEEVVLLSDDNNAPTDETDPKVVHDRDQEILQKFELLMDDVLSGAISLSTAEYNLLFLHLATTTAYSNSDSMAMLHQLYSHMSEGAAVPNGWTHAIVIPALSHKGQAPLAASQLILDMVQRDDYVFDNPEAVIQAMKCLARCNRTAQMEELVRHIRNHDHERITIPVQAIVPLLELYKADQRIDEAMDMIDDYLAEAVHGPQLNDLFSTIVSWPRWRANGERVNISTFQLFLVNKLKMLEQTSRAKPATRVWKQMISELAKSAPRNVPSRETQLIREIIWLLLKRNQHFWPDESLLKFGLEVAAHHNDAKLSVKLLRRLLHEKPRETPFLISNDLEEEGEPPLVRPVIPPQAFVLSMQTCANAADKICITSLLTMLDHPDVKNVPVGAIMNQAVTGFASALDWAEAKATLGAMRDRGLLASDKALGAVIHSLAATGKRAKEGLELFQDIQNGVYGYNAQPGLSCYSAKMLALMQLNEWQKVIDLQQEMKKAGLKSSSVAFQGVILASSRLGESSSVIGAIEEAIQSKVTLNQLCFEQSLKCLMPELMGPSIADIRRAIRICVDAAQNNSVLRQPFLDLSKSLRVAQVEEERQISNMVPQEELEDRRRLAWEKAHSSLVKLHRVLYS